MNWRFNHGVTRAIYSIAIFGFGVAMAPLSANAQGPLAQATEIRVGERVSSADWLGKQQVLMGTSSGGFAGASVLFADDSHRFFRQELNVMYGLTRDFQLRGDFAYINASNTLVTPQAFHAAGDFTLSGRHRFGKLGPTTHGVETGIHLFSGVAGQTGILDGASASIRHVASAGLKSVEFHANTGFLFDRSGGVTGGMPTIMESTSYGLGGYNSLIFGLRGELPVGRQWLPFLEYTGRFPLGAPVSPLRGPQWLTPGVVYRVGDFALNGGVAIGLTRTRAPGVQAALPWQTSLSLSWALDTIDLPYRVREATFPEPAEIVFEAVDAVSGNVVADARFTIQAHPEIVQAVGRVEWSGFSRAITYTVTHPDYASFAESVVVRGGNTYLFAPQLVPRVGWLRGTALRPSESEGPVSFFLDSTTTAATFTADGPFRFAVAPGTYIGYISAPQAVSAPIAVTVAAGVTFNLGTLRLRNTPPPADPTPWLTQDKLLQLLLAAVDAEGRAPEGVTTPAPLESVLELLTQGKQVAKFRHGSSALDDLTEARLAALAQLMLTHPNIIGHIVIEGSSDDVGSLQANTRMSSRRAQAVFDSLQANGVPESMTSMKISVFVRAGDDGVPDNARRVQRKVTVRIAKRGEE